MTRNGYVAFMLCFLIGVPGFISFIVGVLPRRYPGGQTSLIANTGCRGGREESLGYLLAHGMRLACMMVMMMLGMHYTIFVANHLQPPALPIGMFSSILIGFALALYLVDRKVVPEISQAAIVAALPSANVLQV